jgi:hypothetical protein
VPFTALTRPHQRAIRALRVATVTGTTEAICWRYDSLELKWTVTCRGTRGGGGGVGREKRRRRENLGGRGYLYFFQWLKDRKELGVGDEF